MSIFFYEGTDLHAKAPGSKDAKKFVNLIISFAPYFLCAFA
jgi:hypothetical protein